MKILFIYASAGAGHLKAAEAVYNGIKKFSQYDAVLVDALDYSSPWFRSLYRKTYTFLISKIPFVWGFFFTVLDVRWLQPAVRIIRRIQNSINTQRLHRYLQEEQFDYIISTHFLPNEVSAFLKRSGKIRSTIISVVTDYDVHKIWVVPGIDQYAVACDFTKERLKSFGIGEDRIHVTGIPTDERFFYQKDMSQLKSELGMKGDVFTALIATGSFGIGPIEQIIKALNGFQIIVVCGHNQDLFKRLSRGNDGLVKVKGLVDNMYELMAVSDVMVTKPGGLSISEALVSQLPLIFFNAIPGQEEHNVRVLKSYGIGFKGDHIKDIVAELERLKSSKDAQLTAVKKTKELARPSAVNDILALIQ